MKLNINKPLVVFDLETTGLDLVNDRIIQISYIKIFPDGKEKRDNIFVNPQKPIPSEVELLTGITNADVASKPTFKEIAQKLGQKEKSKEQKKKDEKMKGRKKGETEVGVENVTCPNHPEGICPAGLLSRSPDSQRGVPRQAIFPVLLAKGSQC